MTKTKARGFAPAQTRECTVPQLSFEWVSELRENYPELWGAEADTPFLEWQRNQKNPAHYYLDSLEEKYESCRDYNTPAGYLHLARWGLVADAGEEAMRAGIDSLKPLQGESLRAALLRPSGIFTRDLTADFEEIYTKTVGKSQKREAKSGDCDYDSRTASFTFSTETPVERGYYEPWMEVLGHDPGEFNISRLQDSGPLLWNHNTNDVRGVIEQANIGGRKGSTTVKFSRNPLGEELLIDVVDGIKRNVSFGYVIHELILVKESDNSPNVYRATQWEALEVSYVWLGADPNTGMGRAVPRIDEPAQREQPNPVQILTREASNMTTPATEEIARIDAANEKEIQRIRDQETARVRAINTFATRYNAAPEVVARYINEGIDALVAIEEMAKLPDSGVLRTQPTVDLTPAEQRQYSLLKICRAMTKGDLKSLGFEREVHEQIQKDSGASSDGGILIPELPILRQQLIQQMQSRNALVGTPAAGGVLVPTTYDPDQFIDLLRPTTLGSQLGITPLLGLTGNYQFPRKTAAGARPTGITEQGIYPSTQMAFALASMTPKKMGSMYGFSDEMGADGNPSIEALIYRDIMQGLLEAEDTLLFYGTGVGPNPLGLVNTPGINSVVIGANGGDPTWSQIVRMQTLCGIANALFNLAKYATTPAMIGKLKTTLKGANTAAVFLMGEQLLENGMGTLNGHQLGWSNLIRGDRTKGTGTNLNDMFFGAWPEILIGRWGGIEIKRADQHADNFATGMNQIRVSERIDYLNQYPQAFTICTDLSANFV